MDRPLKTWRFKFVKGENVVEFDAEGTTPCNAKAKAFDMLEDMLKLYTNQNRDGWSLKKQSPYVNGVLIDV